MEETLAQLAGAKVFSKLDANSGFWQIPLEEESRLLTTFLTPFGRFCFNKLPFGICSASEHFQKQMSRLLEGLEGVVCQVDDVLVHAPDQKSHDARLNAVLTRMKEKGVTLNREKCSFSQTQLKFLGHMVDEHGVSPDPDKTAAVREMRSPRNITEVRRLLGLANQLGKFSKPGRDLSTPARIAEGAFLSECDSFLLHPSETVGSVHQHIVNLAHHTFEPCCSLKVLLKQIPNEFIKTKSTKWCKKGCQLTLSLVGVSL